MSPPLVVCCGMGQDSTGALVGLHERGIRPDLNIFADVGAEREATMAYIPVLNEWFRRVGFPELTIVRYQCQDFKHWPHYTTLEENCLTNSTLPSIAYGFSKCSAKWKIAPQAKFLSTWPPAVECWAAGGKVLKAIGFDASPYERKRSSGCSTYAVQDEEASQYDLWFPLQDWGWTRADAVAAIQRAGLPVPPKSSCYFCTAMKPDEVRTLSKDQLRRIVIIEARASQRHLDYAEARGWPNGQGIPLTAGLWRKAVKGMRGATPHPGSMTEFIAEQGLLDTEEVVNLILNTPTGPIHAGEIDDWQTWLRVITHAARDRTPPDGGADRLWAGVPRPSPVRRPSAQTAGAQWSVNH